MYDPEAEAWLVIDAAGRKMLFFEYSAAMRAVERYGGIAEPLVRKQSANATTPTTSDRLHERQG